MMSEDGTIARRHDLDALRAFAMLLGIVLHAALSFMPAPWAVQDEAQGQGELFALAVSWIHGFRMPLFFLMSGFFTAMLWRRRGLGALLRHRGLRVLVPLLLTFVTIIPAMNYVIDLVQDKVQNEVQDKEAEEAVGEIGVDPKRNVWLAAAANDAAMLDEQLAFGAGLDAPDPAFGATPLAWAAMQGHDAIARGLLRRGADVNAPNRDGSTPLHGAAFMGRSSTAALLLDNGAKVNARNHNDETPLDSAAVEADATAYIADLLSLTFDDQAVEVGRREASALIAARGGKRGAAPAPPDDDAGKPDEAAFESVAPWYWEFVFAEWLTIGEDGDEPFNFMHTPVFHHLWFLWFLLWLVAGFAAFARLVKERGPLLSSRLVLSPWLFVWAVPLTMALQWFMGVEGLYPTYGPDTSAGLLPQPHILLYYAVFFGFGVAYFDHNESGERISRGWAVMLALGTLAVFPLGVEFTNGDLFGFRDSVGGSWLHRLGLDQMVMHRWLSVALQAAFPWLMTLGFMGLFRAVLRNGSGAVRYVSDAAYWLYVAHLPLVLLAQYAVRSWELPAVVKFVFICIVVTGFLLLCYQGFVRYTPLGALLNGRRTRPAAAAGDA